MNVQDLYTVNQLARMADCGYPDSWKSPGAEFLTGIRDDVAEAIEYEGGQERSISEIADGAVPVYTHEMWQTFVDLQAYREDPSELGFDGEDMVQGAQYCLYMIAERLASALWDDMAQDDDDDEDE